jgi:thiol-disulfide isomerase/thioredoxin
MKIQQISFFLILFSISQLSSSQTFDSLSLVTRTNMKMKELLKEEIYDFKGKKLPEFELTLLNGEKLASNSLKGKPTIINFWFPSCAPCIQKIPSLNKIKSEFSKDVNFIAITFQNKQEIESFLRKKEFNFTHLVDSKEYLKMFGFFAYPKTLILDKDLTITHIEKRIPKDIENEQKNKTEFEGRIKNALADLKKR